MNDLKIAFKNSFMALRIDKLIILLALIPIILGLSIYGLMSSWLFGHLLPSGKLWIEQSVSSAGWGEVVYFLMVGLFTVLLFLFINYTFVLLISILFAPFNDFISARVEKAIAGKNPVDANDSFREMLKNFFKTIWNEFKKVILIFVLSIIAFLIGIIPVLAPIGFIISGLLYSANFLDYSWSRHHLRAGECFSHLFKSLIFYIIPGVLFLVLISIPIMNILILPYSVIFYTCLFVQRRTKGVNHEEKDSSQITER